MQKKKEIREQLACISSKYVCIIGIFGLKSRLVAVCYDPDGRRNWKARLLR